MMLLQRLKEYADRQEEVPPVSYSAEPIRYWIDLDANGRLEGIVAVESEAGGRRPKRVSVPTLVRSVAIKPKLLADNGEYVLGISREEGKAEAVARRHRSFVDLVRRCAEATGEQEVRSVLQFLETLDPTRLDLPDDFDPRQNISFLTEGRRPVDLPAVQRFWRESAAEGEQMQCLVCGQKAPATKRFQLKLKGIPGGQPSGLALISANESAFESYGLEASYVAPTCERCADLFMKGANQLISDESTHMRVGNTVYIFWTGGGDGFAVASMLSKPDPDEVRRLISSAFTGRKSLVDPTPFFASALSASGGRAVVRDWVDTTVARAKEHLARFFILQEVPDAWGAEAHPMGVYGLASATVRPQGRDDVQAWVVRGLVHCALAGGPLPMSLLFKAVERCRLEQGVTRARAALIKAVLKSREESQKEKGGGSMASLETESRDPAYLCGRLFAELEAVQRAALGDVGAGIVARYYGTASSAPATVFGPLSRGAQPHLQKLRRDRPGAYHALDQRLQDIQSGLKSYPTTLSLKQQGMFALGYYHQRAADRHAAHERAHPSDGIAAGEGSGTNAPSDEEA